MSTYLLIIFLGANNAYIKQLTSHEACEAYAKALLRKDGATDTAASYVCVSTEKVKALNARN